jgi:Rod binding domain-containing protein
MNAAAAIAPPVDLLRPTTAAPTGAAKTKAEVARSAEAFEAMFLSSMLGVMFQGVEAQAPFNGGAGEDAFKSFLTDAMAKSMAKAGGIGLADNLSRELLKLQGLTA